MNTAPNPTVTKTTDEAPEVCAANGRFARGNRGGPGNPFARQTAQLRRAMLDAVSPEDMRITIDAVKKRAAEGDIPACKLLLSYCVGKPVPPADPDTLDQHELRTIIANHLDSAVGVLGVLKGMPLDVLMELLGALLPILRSDKVKLAKETLCGPLTAEEIEDAGDDAVPAESPAQDPLADIPGWMQEIGKELQGPAGKPVTKRRKPGRPRTAEADAHLLLMLLERARGLTATQPSPPADTGEPVEPPNSTNRRKPPSANGVHGKK